MLTTGELLKQGEKILTEAGIEDASFDAYQLLLFSGGISETAVICCSDKPVGEAIVNRFYESLERRCLHEPLQYIIGEWDFYKYSFKVGKGVLIPRPETEELAELCIKTVKDNNFGVVYDLCAGSGCIGLSIAADCPEAEVHLFEKYDAAFSFLEQNAAVFNNKNIHLHKHDILLECPQDIPKAQLIVSNPPYISTNEIASLQTEVLGEPESALDGGYDGLMFYRAIAEKWMPRLSLKGCFAFECGENQADSIKKIFSDFGEAKVLNDCFGVQRFVTGVRRNGGM